jgi:uncharacterized protein (DUF1501 family)
MDRRKFLKQLGVAGAAPILLNGIPLNALAANSPLMKMLAASDTDRVVVFIQLHGGNDGLNTVIPVDQYSEYKFLRANIAIPQDGDRQYILLDSDPEIPANKRLGLHPDMQGVKDLYDEDAAAIVQSVGYENMNLSHFRGRDIMFMGIDSDELNIASSWLGRYLDTEFPGYPEGYPNANMPDPLGLELGNEVTLAFQRENSIPGGISIADPAAFFDLINSVGVEDIPGEFPDSYYGDELEYLMKFEIKTNDYAERLRDVYNAGENAASVTYPELYPFTAPTQYINNPLSGQLKIIARLLSGGIKTRLFMTRIGGFDTHADQVYVDRSGSIPEAQPTYGRHAALLYHISESVKAFHDDLKAQGLDDKVLTLTFSEFGRRAESNASHGTDHGKAFPILMFGSGLNPGVYGENPDLSDLDGGNLKYNVDYREVYTTILSDWLGVPDSSISDIGFEEYLSQKIGGLIAAPAAVNDLTDAVNGGSKLHSCYPNPAGDYTKLSYYVDENSLVIIRLYSSSGKLVKEVVNKNQQKGEYQVDIDVSKLSSGNYIYRMQAGKFKAAKIMLIER